MLFGNKNIQKILLFLFVNGKCYGTQLHSQLRTPLTPLQKALQRLEKGGVLLSTYEGKTRIYQFNPAFPLLTELEPLLRKCYTLLPTNEKKMYYVTKEEISHDLTKRKNQFQVVQAAWEKLQTVKHLTFHATTKSKEERGWNGKGQGEISVSKENDHTLVFHEKGTWHDTQNNEMNFSNVFRWTLERHTALISLEHLRYGINSPVFLFHLAPSGNNSLASVDSHLCSGDSYFGQIHYDQHSLRFYWRIIGPQKNEEINYYYTL
jgi:hypothetical protein